MLRRDRWQYGFKDSCTSHGSRGIATVEDLGSTNGTFVNGRQVREPTRLAPGDELSLGSEALQVRRRSASELTVKVNNDAKADEKRRHE